MGTTSRAIIGVIALYALLLQPFLSVATPVLAADADHILCAPDPVGGPAAPEKSTRHDHACCTAVQMGNLSPPPAPAQVADWPRSRFIAVVWRPESSQPHTGPPTNAHSARGPPRA